AATSRAMWRYSTARVYQYGASSSHFATRAASTASSALRVTWLTYAIGPQPAATSSTTSATSHRRIAAIISPRPHPAPIAAELDRHVDRRAEQREQRDHERPAQPHREQRLARVRGVAGVVGGGAEPADPGDHEHEQQQRQRAHHVEQGSLEVLADQHA